MAHALPRPSLERIPRAELLRQGAAAAEQRQREQKQISQQLAAIDPAVVQQFATINSYFQKESGTPEGVQYNWCAIPFWVYNKLRELTESTRLPQAKPSTPPNEICYLIYLILIGVFKTDKYLPVEYIHSGKYGTIMTAVRKNAPDTIVALKFNADASEAATEAKAHQYFFKTNLTVPIIENIEGFSGPKQRPVFLTVMDRIDGTMSTWLHAYHDQNELAAMWKQIVKILQVMQAHNLTHGDLHWGNIGYVAKTVPIKPTGGVFRGKSQSAPAQLERMVLIDFGRSNWAFSDPLQDLAQLMRVCALNMQSSPRVVGEEQGVLSQREPTRELPASSLPADYKGSPSDVASAAHGVWQANNEYFYDRLFRYTSKVYPVIMRGIEPRDFRRVIDISEKYAHPRYIQKLQEFRQKEKEGVLDKFFKPFFYQQKSAEASATDTLTATAIAPVSSSSSSSSRSSGDSGGRKEMDTTGD